MPKVIVNPPWLPKPSGYSHGIEAQGRMLFVAGQTALDTDGRIAHVGDLLGQFRQTLRDLVKVTFYVVDKREYRARAAEIGRVYREMMEGHWPATTLVEVRALWDDEALVEIDAIAVLG